jgi:signal transduction histidine kinase
VLTGNAAESPGTFGSALVSAYSVTRYGDRRRGLLAIPIVVVGAVVHDVEDPEVRTMSQIRGSLMFWLVLVAAWLIGIWVRSRREEAALARHAQELEREAEAAVAAERARIARELRDIVSHNLSVVVLQAAGARAVEERRPRMVGGTLEKIEDSGRAALIEMRRLLGVLHEDPACHELRRVRGWPRCASSSKGCATRASTSAWICRVRSTTCPRP